LGATVGEVPLRATTGDVFDRLLEATFKVVVDGLLVVMLKRELVGRDNVLGFDSA